MQSDTISRPSADRADKIVTLVIRFKNSIIPHGKGDEPVNGPINDPINDPVNDHVKTL